MKKSLALLLAASMAATTLVGCGGSTGETTPAGGDESKQTQAPAGGDSASADALKLWTFPVGEWGGAYVDEVVTAFKEANPGVDVVVEYLDYASGDDQLTAAIEAGTAPDLLLAEPQRLVKYGKNGKLVELGDMFTDEIKTDIGNESIVSACSDGSSYWMYPLTITAHFMAINKEMWESAGALEFVNQEGDRTWTTEDFQKACAKLGEAGVTPGVVYCGGQGGDQGTRALVSNLYSADFTNAEHTEWTINSENGVKALTLLKEMNDNGSMSYDAGMAAADELQLFANGTIGMSFCWNASNAKQYAEQAQFTPYALPFPSDDGEPVLESGLYGFGIFDNGNADKAEAAKKFIDFVCNDAEWGPKSVEAAGFFPVRGSFECYADSADENTAFYNAMLKYVGDNFTAMDGFTEQRTEWWTMLQKVFTDEDIQTAADDYVTKCNEYTASYQK